MRTFTGHRMEADRPTPHVSWRPHLFARLANGIAERVSRAIETGSHPALVTSAARRRFLRTVVQAKGIPAPVLSYEEIGLDVRPALLGQVAA